MDFGNVTRQCICTLVTRRQSRGGIPRSACPSWRGLPGAAPLIRIAGLVDETEYEIKQVRRRVAARLFAVLAGHQWDAALAGLNDEGSPIVIPAVAPVAEPVPLPDDDPVPRINEYRAPFGADDPDFFILVHLAYPFPFRGSTYMIEISRN